MTKLFRYISILLSVVTASIKYISKGWRRGQLLARTYRVVQLFYAHLYQYQNTLKTAIVSGHINHLDNVYSADALHEMRHIATGLHHLLPGAENYRYSFLIPVDNPNPRHFELLLKCVLNLSAPNKEILLGFNGQQSAEIVALVERFGLAAHIISPKMPFCLLYNKLAELATGNYLLIVDPEGWIRADLLYRYEQTLRLQLDHEKILLYSLEGNLDDEELINEENSCTLFDTLHFPYLFFNFNHACVLVSQKLWQHLQGFREEMEGAALYDFVLRANLCQTHFIKIPTMLTLCRKNLRHRSLTAQHSLQSYVHAKQLDWEVSAGYNAHSVRARPKIAKSRQVHAIIPFKDQRKLTLKAVQSLIKQKDVSTYITAIDNGSQDRSLIQEMENLGVEVLVIDEPFNFSRLNNLAVKRSKIGKECDLLLFMNNDVELESDAALEMCRWIDQPRIGMVGCRLHYPDGLLQCGGIDINKKMPQFHNGWDVLEKTYPFEKLDFQLALRTSGCVNGACLLIKKDLYAEIEGFDEIWYPVAQSDTNISLKIQKKGLLCFYTPFAHGIHHETVTRTINPMEDYENSPWLQSQYFAMCKDDGN